MVLYVYPMFLALKKRTDILTKGLHKGPFQMMISKLSMEDIFRPA